MAKGVGLKRMHAVRAQLKDLGLPIDGKLTDLEERLEAAKQAEGNVNNPFGNVRAAVGQKIKASFDSDEQAWHAGFPDFVAPNMHRCELTVTENGFKGRVLDYGWWTLIPSREADQLGHQNFMRIYGRGFFNYSNEEVNVIGINTPEFDNVEDVLASMGEWINERTNVDNATAERVLVDWQDTPAARSVLSYSPRRAI